MDVYDRQCVHADLGSLLAEHKTSIASLIQMEADAVAGTAELIMTTHETKEADLEAFREAVNGMESVHDIGVRIRMETARA